ncbi:MAG: protein-glutamate O-methyltransferase CheR [Caulobacteraceae bacterium]
MKPEDISLLVSLCRARAGLRVAPEKTYMIESRLAPVARRENYPSISDMLGAVRTQRDERLIWAVVEAMTAGESAFFQDRASFKALRNDILPRLAAARGSAPIRIWSAACGAGQEVYSLAMLADELAADYPAMRVELAASDLAERSLEKAQSGLYSAFEVQRGLPIRKLVDYFEKDGDSWRLAPRIRQMVRWRRINLVAGLAGLGSFDVVVCRHALCNMTPPAQKLVLEALAEIAMPDGYLILGVKETCEATDAFLPVQDAPGVFARNPAFRAAA